MARKAWIAVLGFGLVLFLLFDILALGWAINSEQKLQVFGLFSGLVFVTWQDFLALRKRMNSKPAKQAVLDGTKN